jgi:glycerol-3-phosphate dehydrogenase
MKRDIKTISQGQYDLLVIGGGINGAAIAHMACLNGLKTVLLEKGDFASGTSSKSTKLIHGGLRYLENFEFGLVREALKERSIQLKSAPHLVKPLSFIVPVYATDARPLWMIKLGVALYDLLSGKDLIQKHQTLTASQIADLIPGIKKDGLIGGVSYFDAQMDDARLCLENILSAANQGAHVANYVEVKSIIKENGRAVGVNAYDVLGQVHFEVRARKIVCALGAWTNAFAQKEGGDQASQVRTTKGVHLLYRGRISDHALLIPTKKEQRVFFVIPWHGHSLIGTTDTDYFGDPDKVFVEDADIDYLLGEAQRVFPRLFIERKNIYASFAGLRPLAAQPGAPSKISRRHVIKESYTGIIHVLGGKYTTYRKIAEETISFLLKRKAVSTEKNYRLYGGTQVHEDPMIVGQFYGISPASIEHLINLYGSRFRDVLALSQSNPVLKEKIVSNLPSIKAQIKYSIETEMAQTADDILSRRLSLIYTESDLNACRQLIKEFMPTK